MFRIPVLAFLLLSLVGLQSGPKVEKIPALTESSVAEAVRGALETSGYKVSNDGGKVMGEVWFCKEVATESGEVAGAAFGQIPEGSFIGVFHLSEPNIDYRGQTIKAGFYTLRYALILEDGNHQGVAPGKDFVLLAPVDQDQDPSAKIVADKLLKLSRAAAGSAHPSPWSLVPVSDSKNLPRVIKNEHDHIILQTKLNTRAGPINIGMIVFGKTEG